MAAQVRVVSQTPNQHMLVGFPGISATLPRLEGKVELRPKDGVSAALTVSMVTVCLQRRESIHPQSDSMIQRHLAAPRKEVLELVGKEMLLYKCPPGKESEQVYAMDLPFVLFIPYGRGGQEASQRVPAASLQLPHRTAETMYEIIVMVQQGASFNSRFNFPTPIARYDTLSTFGMYNRPEAAERTTDHLVTLGITLQKWSYGPHDQIKVYVKLAPNPDWVSKAKKVKIKRIAIGIEEEIIYNHEGDEPVRKTRSLAANKINVDQPLPDAGYWNEMGLLFPAVDQRKDGILPRGDNAFPRYAVSGFTTTGSLYKIDYFLTVKATLTSAKDILLRQPIVVCPLDQSGCKEEMGAIEAAAKEAAQINPDNPMLPAPIIVKKDDYNGLHILGMTMVGGKRRLLIE